MVLWGYSILYKECNLTRFNHQKNIAQLDPNKSFGCLLRRNVVLAVDVLVAALLLVFVFNKSHH